jgi:3,4-dihydroxy 2-butanone 4-phosphate synthase / GTP cyclohydrolase II
MSVFAPTDEIIAELAAGRMVVIVDDEERENEGDLIMAAEAVTPADINFMAKYGRGLICLTLTRAHCDRLRLPLMVTSTHAEHRTNFTLSIEAASGVTTGISAQDRAHTIRTAVKPKVRPEELRQPGHIFPLMAQPGGVLTRAGHTEAGCDLMQLAGMVPAAVICEIMNEDGTMARRPDLEVFAKTHGLKMGTIADLIRYRLSRERSIERIEQRAVETEFGSFELHVYNDRVHHAVHLALVRGDIRGRVPLVRVQIEETLKDVLGIKTQRSQRSTRDALEWIAKEGCGVLVLLRSQEPPELLLERIRGLDTTPLASRVLRTYGIGAQILKDLGIQSMRVLSAPIQLTGLAAFGIEVVEYVEHKTPATAGLAQIRGFKQHS